MTPSRNGRIATTLAGVRPTISLACTPIASGRRLLLSIATHDGSLITIPFPRTLTSVFAVPKSIPMSKENNPISQLKGLNAKIFSYSLMAQRLQSRFIEENYTIARLSDFIKVEFGGDLTMLL